MAHTNEISLHWRIERDADATEFGDVAEADEAACSMAIILRETVRYLPLRAFVYVHEESAPRYCSIDGVIRRWREKDYDVHALVELNDDVRLSELGFRQKLLEGIDSMHASRRLSRVEEYETWTLIPLDENAFMSMRQADDAKAGCPAY